MQCTAGLATCTFSASQRSFRSSRLTFHAHDPTGHLVELNKNLYSGSNIRAQNNLRCVSIGDCFLKLVSGVD